MNENTKKKKNPALKIGMIIAFIVFALYSLSLLFPFVWIMINSLRSVSEWQETVDFKDFWGLPKNWDLTNYLTILNTELQGGNLTSMIIYSVILTVLGTIINVFFSACAAYVIAKYDFPGKKLIYSLAIFAMVVPIVGTLPAQVKFMETLELEDSIIGVLFLYSGAFGFNFILLHSSFESISWSYAEASFIDGGSDWYTFLHIMLPQAKPIVITFVVLGAIGAWNDYSTPLIYLPAYPTLALGIYQFEINMVYGGSYPIFFAAMMMSMVPVLIAFILFQDQIMGNLSIGGLKG